MVRLESLNQQLVQAQTEYARAVKQLAAQQELQKERIAKSRKLELVLFGLFWRLLIISVSLALLYILRRLFLFLFPFLKQKNNFKRSLLGSKYRLSVILLYNLLARILNIFGLSYPVIIDPEEYSLGVARRFEILRDDCNKITALFLRARYSRHNISKQEAELALSSYRVMLNTLKGQGSFWQGAILRLGFAFKL